MKLSRLQIEHFKNHETADFSFCDQFNFITGGNGLGKTNLLDAIHYACSGRSFFGRSDTYAIQFDEEFAFIKAEMERGIEASEEVKISISSSGPAKKQIHVDGGRRSRVSDHYGFVPVVMFTPAEIKLVNEGSRERRKFLDRIMSQANADFLKDIIEYSKLIDSRNELLSLFRERGNFDEIALQAYDERLIPVMDRIHEARRVFISEFSAMVEHAYSALTNEREKISLAYISDLSHTDAKSLLSSNLNSDKFAARTTAGIHKDDLELSLNGHLIRAIGSQGQIKTSVIALHLAAYQFLKDKLGSSPLLLLDDIFEKIDEQRAGELLHLIGRDDYGQIFITDTDESRIERHMSKSKADKKIFKFEPPRTRLMSDEQPLKKLIQVMMKNYQLDERMRQKQVEQKWPEIVGDLIAKHTSSINISENTLFVRVNSAPLKAELSFHRTVIKEKVNAFLGSETIREVRIS